jgi:hypothetical protein
MDDLLEKVLEHVKSRRAFGQSLNPFRAWAPSAAAPAR